MERLEEGRDAETQHYHNLAPMMNLEKSEEYLRIKISIKKD